MLWEFGEGMAVIAESASGAERPYWALADLLPTRSVPRPRRAMTAFRAGLIAVVGRPNVGKSTLVNALVGRKVSIVSDKPQTTRRGLHAVLTTEDAQAVFTDTPGFHKPKTELGARLNDMVGDAVEGVDVILHVVDAASGIGRGDAFVYERRVRPHACPKIAVVNKIDVIGKHGVVPQLAAAAEIGDYDEIVPVSARAGKGIGMLRDMVLGMLPEGRRSIRRRRSPTSRSRRASRR